MDLAIYINELLGLKGEVNVPGIGFFQQKRVSGYYNDNEKKFYPPHHDIVFDPQSKDDDELAAYISNKKNISPASAKYFIEKYTTGLKTHATEQKVDITGLGHLFYEYSMLTFKADKAYRTNDPSFYGLMPAKVNKGAVRVVPEEKPQVTREPETEKIAPEPVMAEPVVEEIEAEEKTYTDTLSYIPQEAYDEEAEKPHRTRIWVIMLLVLIVALLGFGVLYQYNPALFGKKAPVDTTIIVKGPAPAKKDTAKTTAKDTSKAAAKDTTAAVVKPASAAKPAIDTFATKHSDLLGGTFKSLKNATAEMTNDKTLGLNPQLRQNGNYYTITLGTFFNKKDAQRVYDSIFNIKGIHKQFIYITNYSPSKK